MTTGTGISVVLPIRNAAAYIDEAIRSILTQRLSPLELILVDDDADDATVRRLAAWRDADARVRVIPCEGDGLIDALNTGLAHARGFFVARMDGDDIAHADRFLLQHAFFTTRGNVSVVSCLVESFPRARVREGYRIYERWLNALTEPDAIAREIFVESPLPHPSVLYPVDVIRGIGGYVDDGGPEDYDLWLRLHAAGHRFAKVPEVLHLWRDHPDRLSRVDDRYALERFLSTKARHLIPALDGRPVVVWGAGMIGRRMSRQIIAHGGSVDAFVDIDAKKIGRTLRGRPIVAPDALADPSTGTIVLSAVGSRNARTLIRRRVLSLGYVEGESFVAVA